MRQKLESEINKLTKIIEPKNKKFIKLRGSISNNKTKNERVYYNSLYTISNFNYSNTYRLEVDFGFSEFAKLWHDRDNLDSIYINFHDDGKDKYNYYVRVSFNLKTGAHMRGFLSSIVKWKLIKILMMYSKDFQNNITAHPDYNKFNGMYSDIINNVGISSDIVQSAQKLNEEIDILLARKNKLISKLNVIKRKEEKMCCLKISEGFNIKSGDTFKVYGEYADDYSNYFDNLFDDNDVLLPHHIKIINISGNICNFKYAEWGCRNYKKKSMVKWKLVKLLLRCGTDNIKREINLSKVLNE